MGLAIQLTGALLVLAAFGLLQLKVLEPTALGYLLMNAVGSAVLATDAALDAQWGFVLLNTVWCLVSLGSLARSGRGRFRRPAGDPQRP